MAMMNGYRKGWALRYLREAKAEFSAAKETPYLAPSLILEALRKAQVAIYYSLGDPASIQKIVHLKASGSEMVKDPVLKCLVEIEHVLEWLSDVPESEREKAMKHVENLIQIAADIVELFTGDKA